jgi:hypothetical protein
MRIIFSEALEWEPFVVRLKLSGKGRPNVEQIQNEEAIWFSRDFRRTCDCEFKFVAANYDAKERTLQLVCEWLCTRCLPAYMNHLKKRYSQVSICFIGPDWPPSDQAGHEYVTCNSKQVLFEDGSVQDVASFFIARRAVSVAGYREFVESTGYKTTAEAVGESELFYDNFGIRGLPKSLVERSPVACVSYHDANAYCEWKGLRLPTESEWLAAAVVDETLYDTEGYRRLFDKGGKFVLASHSMALELTGAEWVSSSLPGHKAVLRRGPRYVRLIDWQQKVAQHREIVDDLASDVMTTFRTCR